MSGLVKSPNYLDVFTGYAGSVTDAPEIFNEFSGLFSLSCAVARNMKLAYGQNDIYPNLWVFLLGSSGSRKTTSMNVAREIVQLSEACGNLPNEFSQEALIGKLKETPGAAIWCSEMSNFMGQLRKKYNDGIIGSLTDLYDVPEVYKRATRGDGSIILERPTVNVFACSTPDFMNVNKEEWASGFGPRFLLVPAARTSFKAWPDPKDRNRRNQLVAFLKYAARLNLEVVISPEAKARWCDWATRMDETVRQKTNEVQAFFNRVLIYSLKIAILHRVGALDLWTPEGMERECRWLYQRKNQLPLNQESISYGSKMARKVLQDYARALQEAHFAGEQRLGPRMQDAVERVLEVMRNKGGMVRLSDLSKMRITASERRDALDVLTQDGVVSKFQEKKYSHPQTGKPLHGALWFFINPSESEPGVDNIEAAVNELRQRSHAKKGS